MVIHGLHPCPQSEVDAIRPEQEKGVRLTTEELSRGGRHACGSSAWRISGSATYRRFNRINSERMFQNSTRTPIVMM